MTDRGEKDFFELLRALNDWPKMPSPYMLHQIGGNCGEWPADYNRGNEIQRELPMGRIPFTTECEKGAGFWDRITQGAWRTVEDDTLNVRDEKDSGQ